MTNFADLESLSDLYDTRPSNRDTFLTAQTNYARNARPAPTYRKAPAERFTPPSEVVEKLQDMAARGNSFAVSVLGQFRSFGGLSRGQISTVERIIADDATRAQPHAVPTAQPVPAPVAAPATSTVDLRHVPEGFYAVPGSDTRLKVKIEKPEAPSKWADYIFVSDGAEYGQRQKYGMQRRGAVSYDGKIVDQLRIIASDPRAASAAYGKLVGRCGCCGRKLENAASVEMGIGPVCAANNGW